jgi:RNA-binding protein
MTTMESERKTPKTSLNNTVLRQYRAIAHKLNPVVRVGGNGLSQNVLAEVDRALADHELIKIKIAVGDRDLRDSLIEQLCQTASAELVQRIGNTATLLRRNPQADPRKSNLQRVL